MPDASAQIVAEKVAETRDALLRHRDAVDAKAGVLLGAAGAFVALAFTMLEGSSARRCHVRPGDLPLDRGQPHAADRRLTVTDDPKRSSPSSAPSPQGPPPEPPPAPPFSPDLDLIGDLERGQKAALEDRRR